MPITSYCDDTLTFFRVCAVSLSWTSWMLSLFTKWSPHELVRLCGLLSTSTSMSTPTCQASKDTQCQSSGFDPLEEMPCPGDPWRTQTNTNHICSPVSIMGTCNICESLAGPSNLCVRVLYLQRVSWKAHHNPPHWLCDWGSVGL